MISLIAAFAGERRVIGQDGDTPWHIPEDLAHFKSLTTGHPVVMGRKTFESIIRSLGHPLRGRTNIVLSRSMAESNDDIIVARILEEALAKAEASSGSEEVFVIGGEDVFRQTLASARHLYLTRVDAEINGDTFFPPYEHLFSRTLSSETRTLDNYTVTFQTLGR